MFWTGFQIDLIFPENPLSHSDLIVTSDKLIVKEVMIHPVLYIKADDTY